MIDNYSIGATYSVKKKKFLIITYIFLSSIYAYSLASIPNIYFKDRVSYIFYPSNLDFYERRLSSENFFLNEPGFWFYNNILVKFFDIDLIPKVSVFIISFTLLFFILYYSRNVVNAITGVLLLFFVSYTFHLQLVVLRQGIAAAIFLWGVYFFWDSKIKLITICLICTLIHISFILVLGIILLDLFLERKIKSIKLRVMLIGLSIFASSLLMVGIARSLGLRQAQSDYLTITNAGGGGFVLFIFMLTTLYLRGFNNVYSNKYGRISILGITAYLAFYFTLPVSGRLVSTFLPFLYIYTVSSNNSKVITSAIIFLLVNLYLFISSISTGSLTYIGAEYLRTFLN